MYKTGKVAPLQVAEILLPLIRQGSSPLGEYENAWIDADGQEEQALAAAKASTERWASGKPLGLLDGVPIGIKDELHVKGLRTYWGMGYRSDILAFQKQEESIWPVTKLQEAGAVIIGKNRMAEIGSGKLISLLLTQTSADYKAQIQVAVMYLESPSSLLAQTADQTMSQVIQGTPTNHCNPSYYPGGSTSGGGSALGAGVVPIVLGADAGGSTRIPASFNGVFGLKTSHHRTMTFGHTMGVVSPMAATAADLAIAYRVTTQPNSDDGIQRQFALSKPPAPGAKRVMGVYRDWWREADPRVAAICEKALEYFARERGYEIIDIEIPYISEARTAHGLICIAETAEMARRRTPNPADWLGIVGPANKLLLSVASQTPTADYLKCNSLRELLMRHMAFLFQKYPGLLIMTPTTAMAGWPVEPGDKAYGLSDSNKIMKSMAYIWLANMTGTPAVTAPVGYIRPDQGEGDLPIGVMATGEWGAEEQLLEWASEAEEYLHEKYEGGRQRPKTWLDVMGLFSGGRSTNTS